MGGISFFIEKFSETDKMKEEITLKVNAVGELEISKETKKKMLTKW